MLYGEINHFQTGVAIPVSGLRTFASEGIGEYLDLIVLGQWANKCGMDLIQILPINDTGLCSSPYSALSAFALNPVYLRLGEVPQLDAARLEIQEFSRQHNGARVDYAAVYQFKMAMLAQAWTGLTKSRKMAETLDAWLKKNPWCLTYALYSHYKQENSHRPWWDWEEKIQQVSSDKILRWQKSHKDVIRFYAWVQLLCEEQLCRASQTLHDLGIKLKGDIPILINEDSADAWGYPELFDMKNRAGAPPDMFCYSGQNWGFPCYRWDVLKAQNYGWWRERLQRASHFYHAFRIDHVLGFFRIWQVPVEHRTGMLGRFNPSLPITSQELKQIGLDEKLILRLSRAHFQLSEIQDRLVQVGLDPLQFFERNPDGWYYFRSEYHGEKQLDRPEFSEAQKDLLINLMWNRVLLTFDEAEGYFPYWYYYNSQSFQNLPEATQSQLRDLFGRKAQQQEDFWEKNGEELLRMMSTETDMLVCAEDLGVVPNCVAPVLKRLNILSLKIERWTRDWSIDGAPFVNPREYPRLSVNSPSCHDTTTLRGWWEEDSDRQTYARSLGLSGDQVPDYLTTELAHGILQQNLAANSLVCIFPIQDWMSLHYDLRVMDSDDERINIPGTLGENNWSWRLHLPLENLVSYDIFNQQVLNLVQERKFRPL